MSDVLTYKQFSFLFLYFCPCGELVVILFLCMCVSVNTWCFYVTLVNHKFTVAV